MIPLWPFAIAFAIIIVVFLIWLFLAFHPPLRDRYDHAVRHRFHTELRWFHVHLVLALLIAFLLGPLLFAGAYYVGYQTATRYDAQYFQQHYANPGLCLAVRHHHCLRPGPAAGRPLPISPVPTLPTQGSITVSLYPAVGNQGPLGSCAAWASAWAASYEYRVDHPGSVIRYSPRCEYDHVVKTYNGGHDIGSFPNEDLEVIPTGGVTKFWRVPYGSERNGRPAFAIDTPVPGGCSVYGVKENLRLISMTPFATGAGQAAVDDIRSVLAGSGTVDRKSHPVLLGFEVYNEYDNATMQPLVVSPKAGEVSRGLHENVAIAYDDTKLFPDGSIGGVLVQNQWTTYWGIGGRAWLSYDFIRKYAMGLQYLTTAPGQPGAAKNAPPADGGKRPFLPAPGAPRVTKPIAPPAPKAAGWYISDFKTRDTGLDITGLINYNHWGIWPVYLLAVVLAESAGNQYAHRWGVWPDVSFGLVQVTTQTLTAYYGGCGYNSYCAQSYLYNAATAIDLGAHILSDYRRMTGVGYPALWECYNAGPGSCQSPYYESFLQNYYVALSYATGSPGPGPTPPPPPKPKPFPKKLWYQWCKNHPHKPCQSHLWNGKRSWAASVWYRYQGLGPVTGHEQWFPKSTSYTHGFMKNVFKHGDLYCWPYYKRCAVYGQDGRRLKAGQLKLLRT